MSREKISWEGGVNIIFGHDTPDDSLEIRNSFIEGCMTDEWGDHFTQAPIHHQMQQALWEWEKAGMKKGLITAPPDSGKSQQLPIADACYFQTRVHELQQLIISADDKQVKKRVRAIRALTRSPDYLYWCKQHNFAPLTLSTDDTGSSDTIYFRSKNRTGNPSIEAFSVLSNTLGQRAHKLWLDDVCTTKDKNSKAHRNDVYDRVSNTWTKRVRVNSPLASIYGIRTKWHPKDANSLMIASGEYAHLQITINKEKTAYEVREYRPVA